MSLRKSATADAETETDAPAEIAIPIPEGAVLPVAPGESFSDLARELSGMSNSRELLKVKEDLVGVPMILTSFTFRQGPKRRDGAYAGQFGDYVSVEATTYDNRRVVFNDGSTGVRTQIVHWLVSQGMLPQETEVGRGFMYWDFDQFKGAVVREPNKDNPEDLNGHVKFEAHPDGRPIRFLARHGLRKSEYKFDPSDPQSDATTFYID